MSLSRVNKLIFGLFLLFTASFSATLCGNGRLLPSGEVVREEFFISCPLPELAKQFCDVLISVPEGTIVDLSDLPTTITDVDLDALAANPPAYTLGEGPLVHIGRCATCTAGQFCTSPRLRVTAGAETEELRTPMRAPSVVDEVTCTAGSFCPENQTLIACPAGMFCPAGSSVPTICPESMDGMALSCPMGSAQPTACPAGYYCTSVDLAPVACPAGNRCPTAVAAPEPCASHEYCPQGTVHPKFSYLIAFVIPFVLGLVLLSVCIAVNCCSSDRIKLGQSSQLTKSIISAQTIPLTDPAPMAAAPAMTLDLMNTGDGTPTYQLMPVPSAAHIAFHQDLDAVSSPLPLVTSPSLCPGAPRDTGWTPRECPPEASNCEALEAEDCPAIDYDDADVAAELGAKAGSCEIDIAAAAVTSAIESSSDCDLGFDGATIPFNFKYRNVTLDVASAGRVLKGVSGELRPGELMALIGGSGCGKTSLLSAIGGRATYGVAEGVVTINGVSVPLGAPWLARDIAFIPQSDDSLYPDLTVYENVMFSAKTRMPADVSQESLARRVSAVLALLGISNVANRLVGDSSHRGISGGQKKRVNIACELVCSPSVLLGDEITSGLDARASFLLLDRLRAIARRFNIAVCLVLHQPRYSIFELLDSVTFMQGGRECFVGPTKLAARYFAEVLGTPIPQSENPADFMLDVIEGPAGKDSTTIWSERGASIVAEWMAEASVCDEVLVVDEPVTPEQLPQAEDVPSAAVFDAVSAGLPRSCNVRSAMLPAKLPVDEVEVVKSAPTVGDLYHKTQEYVDSCKNRRPPTARENNRLFKILASRIGLCEGRGAVTTGANAICFIAAGSFLGLFSTFDTIAAKSTSYVMSYVAVTMLSGAVACSEFSRDQLQHQRDVEAGIPSFPWWAGKELVAILRAAVFGLIFAATFWAASVPGAGIGIVIATCVILSIFGSAVAQAITSFIAGAPAMLTVVILLLMIGQLFSGTYPISVPNYILYASYVYWPNTLSGYIDIWNTEPSIAPTAVREVANAYSRDFNPADNPVYYYLTVAVPYLLILSTVLVFGSYGIRELLPRVIQQYRHQSIKRHRLVTMKSPKVKKTKRAKVKTSK